MDYKRIITAAASFALMVSAFSCGKTDTDESGASESQIEISTENSTKDSKTDDFVNKEDEVESSGKSSAKTTAAQRSGSEKTETTTASSAHKIGETAKSAGTSANNSGNGANSEISPSSGNSASADTSSQENSGSASSVSSGSKSENSVSGGNSQSSGGSSDKSTSGENSSSSDNTTPTGTPSVEETYTATVNLGSSPSITGENVSANGSVVTISGGGTFYFSGSVDNGQIYVDTADEEKVKILLDGVSISNSSGPAILVNDAKKCIIELVDGTESVLSDGAKDKVNDGVIFSNDTLKIKGGGSLKINANNAHGIASDDDIVIDGGNFDITSKKSGIFAHDDITINDGNFSIKGGTNGIKSKGTMNINGGYAVLSGGTKEEKSSVFAAGAFNYTGGYLFAAGNQVSVPTTSANPYIVVDLGESTAAGTLVEMVLGGTQMISFEPQNPFRCLMMLAPEIASGDSFYTIVGGSTSGEYTVADGQNLFTIK